MGRLEETFEANFKCSKCGSGQSRAKKISTTGSGLSKFFDVQANNFLAVSCQNCGYVELYNRKVLEGKSDLSSVVDLLFGG